MMVYFGYFLALLGLLVLALALFIWRQGDADFLFETGKRSPLVLERETSSQMVFSFRIPFYNRGSQQGTLMDVFARPWLPSEQFSAAEISTKVAMASNPRGDGYWEATLFPNEKVDHDVVIVKLQFDAPAGNIRQVMEKMVDLQLNIIYQVVARAEWYLSKVMVEIPMEEFHIAMQKEQDRKVEA
jgi:hypothetical protein